jgi:predicted ABC-type ATPase
VPELVIIAGPNGAGKTTFAREYLSKEGAGLEFINADEIARISMLEPGANNLPDIRAGRIMLDRIDALVNASASLVIETTLASLTYARKIPRWRDRGYMVSLVYLRLPSVDESIARVRKRVEAGGHNIPEDVIRRRFSKSIVYFESIYKPVVDSWYIWESREGSFVQLASSEDQ